MSKELEKAIKRALITKHRGTTLISVETLETALNYIENSIPKEKVEKVFETKIYNMNYLASTDWLEQQKAIDLEIARILKIIEEELLEGK